MTITSEACSSIPRHAGVVRAARSSVALSGSVRCAPLPPAVAWRVWAWRVWAWRVWAWRVLVARAALPLNMAAPAALPEGPGPERPR
ncbi:hypothetical protein [Frankia sp. Cas4]|uniref:hypothetical protein n=1 Tax=Frankia sp. Cas4 TaxID=3073927 RepID=UPI002AD3B810|nr:hypothetical protein [Frankia sp. Cas4]